MSDWRLSADSTIYKEALRATEALCPPTEGFVKTKEIAGKALEVIAKQNNTLIQLLLKLTEKVEGLKVAVRRIETAKAKEVAPSDDLSDSLEQIQVQLKKLSLGELSRLAISRPKGKLFVFKDPKKILETERKKLK